MYADVHFLGGKLVTVREVDVTTKAHQRHEGSPYSPFETTPQRLSQSLVVDLGVVSKPSQTFPGVITKVDSSPKDSYRLGVSNLQE